MPRKIFNGSLQDTSATVDAALADQAVMWLANIYMIGESYDSRVLMITDWEAPLLYQPLGLFQQGVTKRSSLAFKVGLDVTTFSLTYAPGDLPFTGSVVDTSPLQLVNDGYYDLKPFRMWRVWMPTPGDANTWGVTPMFGGWVKQATVTEDGIAFSANCFLDVLNQQVPANTIDNSNMIASFAGAKPPAGFTTIPRFVAYAPSDTQVITLACTNFPGYNFPANILRYGYLVFDKGANQSLGGYYSIIGANQNVVILDVNYTQVTVYAPFPSPPVVGVDTCYASAPAPVDASEGTQGVDLWTFPYVPSPESAG